jgi:hypothetical protein
MVYIYEANPSPIIVLYFIFQLKIIQKTQVLHKKNIISVQLLLIGFGLIFVDLFSICPLLLHEIFGGPLDAIVRLISRPLVSPLVHVSFEVVFLGQAEV